MKLLIISPQKKDEFDVEWVEVNTKAGNFIVLPDHAPLVATLSENEEVVFCFPNGKQEVITPKGGTVEVSRKSVTLLLTALA